MFQSKAIEIYRKKDDIPESEWVNPQKAMNKYKVILNKEFIDAAGRGETKTVQALREEHGNYINFNKDQAFLAAAKAGHADTVELLLSYGIRGEAIRLGSRFAAGSGQTDIVELLLTRPALRNAAIVGSYREATKAGHASTVMRLFELTGRTLLTKQHLAQIDTHFPDHQPLQFFKEKVSHFKELDQRSKVAGIYFDVYRDFTAVNAFSRVRKEPLTAFCSEREDISVPPRPDAPPEVTAASVACLAGYDADSIKGAKIMGALRPTQGTSWASFFELVNKRIDREMPRKPISYVEYCTAAQQGSIAPAV